MKLLAIDTSCSACSIALQIDDEVKSSHSIAPMQQARLILPMIQDLLASTDVKLNDIDAVAFGCGPGSFTGVRLASSVAQGIGFAISCPIIRISSMAAMAQTALIEHGWHHLMVALDARMGQIYWASYQLDQYGCVGLIGDEQLCSPAEIKPSMINSAWIGIGDAWANYQEILVKSLGFEPAQIDTSLIPTAEAILKLAIPKYQNHDWVTPNAAIPNYLRG